MKLDLGDDEESIKDLHNQLPPDFRPTGDEIKAAYYLFGSRNDIRPDLRILIGSWERNCVEGQPRKPDRTYPTLRIILNNRLCLFFYGNSGEWLFDGYECGNYEGYWTEFDWDPERRTQC